MSNKELATTNTGYVIPAISDEQMSGITAELDGLPISLDKIQIPAGGGVVFEVPGDDLPQGLPADSPDLAKEVIGVIVDHYPINSYWTEKYNGQNIPPVCYSTDSHIGVGEPGGECAKCPYNKFGSDIDGQSKACKNAHRLYILRSGELYPVVITVPPTSLKSLSDYLAKRIVTKGLRSYGVVTKLTLKKATNSTGIAYSQVQFTMLEKLSPEASETLRQFGESIKPITRRIDFMDVEDTSEEETSNEVPPMVDPETGEIIEPLNN